MQLISRRSVIGAAMAFFRDCSFLKRPWQQQDNPSQSMLMDTPIQARHQ